MSRLIQIKAHTPQPVQRRPVKLPAGRLKPRGAAPAPWSPPDAGSTPGWAFSVLYYHTVAFNWNGRKTRKFRSEQLNDDGGHCHHFLRQSPEVTLHASQVYFILPRRRSTVRASGNQTIVSPIRRSLAWICVSARPGEVCGLQTRSSARSRGHRYCTAASCLNTSSPHSLCFRFPLPAHDCLTMGGNGS